MTNNIEHGPAVPGREPSEGSIGVSPQEVDDWVTLGDGAVQIIDVRRTDEREAGHIPGTLHIGMLDLPDRAASIDRDRPVVFYCATGNRSGFAAKAALASGYDAHSMIGGLVIWRKEGRPFTPSLSNN